MSWVAWASLAIAIVYFFILLPFFAYIILNIINEQMDETIQTLTQKDFFNKMFDSLQEGICTIDNDKILFMNELCNTLTS
jgi:predicted PurR-regulated permease PerM